MTDAVLPNVTVYVVDDDDAVRDSVKVLLEVNGLRVEDYASTADFARGFQRPGRGCLLLDQHLPSTTGIDFLKSDEGRELGIPVILITGRGDPALEQQAREAGVVGYLQKPISAGVLLATIGQAIVHQDNE
ncbi:MAG TPA: response regulator [Stellaceae bacterium]|nr:response regulator [Stellaceae bacterium]